MLRTLDRRFARLIVIALLLPAVPAGKAAEQSAPEVLFRDVRVFDGKSATLSSPTAVLVRGNRIAAIGAGAVPANPAVTIIDGGGRTLMPGLIDAHVHIMFATIPQLAVLTSDIGFVNVAAAKAAPARATSPTASASAQPPSPTTRTRSASGHASSSPRWSGGTRRPKC